MAKKKSKKWLWFSLSIIALMIIVGVVWLATKDTSQSSIGTYNGKEVMILVPHMASYKCDVIGSASPTYNIPQDGFWISASQIGANTDKVTDIKVTIKQSIWESYLKNYLGGGVRTLYRVCNQNQQNCAEYTQRNEYWGTFSIENLPSAVNLDEKSVYIVIQSRMTILSSWSNSPAQATVSLSYNKFGLRLFSTTVDPAGKIVCTASCDLTCPELKSRQKSTGEGHPLETNNNIIPFYETAPYLEFWDSPAQVGEQLGGTYWNANKYEFCFGGYIYSADTLKTDTKSYVYPKSYLRKEECCPDAVISTVYENKKCNSNYKWETLSSNIACNSVYQCPNQGTDTCQLKSDGYYKSGWTCDKICKQQQETKVACCPPSHGCPSDQVCQNYICVSGNINPPIINCNKDSDCNQYPNGTCVNNLCSYPECSIDPTLEKCGNNGCGCWISLPEFLGGNCIVPNLWCKFTTWLNEYLKPLKIGLGVILGLLSGIVSFLFVDNIIGRFKPRKRLRLIWIPILAGIIIAGLVGLITYYYFWLGIIIVIVVGVLKFIVKRA